jgi:SAM-dependent methyltransferase
MSQPSIEWKFPNNHIAKLQWANKFHKYIQNCDKRILELDSNIAILSHSPRKQLHHLTVQRMETLKALLIKQKAEMTSLAGAAQLVSVSQPNAEASDGNLHETLHSRIPSNQHVLSYYKNIFRDWAWPDSGENDEIYALVQNLLKPNKGGSTNALVLGSGAGRLAFDLSPHFSKITLFDHSPVLMTIAHKMIGGEKLALTEICDFPMSIGDMGKLWELSASGKKQTDAKFQFVLGDIRHLPFVPEAYDLVVTPWILDIGRWDVPDFIHNINSVLKTGGQWIQVGPLGFGNGENIDSPSKDEIVFYVKELGFELNQQVAADVTYLHSPLDQQKRMDSVLCFSATKVKHVGDVKTLDFLPSWIVDTSQPTPSLESLGLELQQTAFQHLVLQLNDGSRSIKQMATKLSQQILIPEIDAERYLQLFYTQHVDR